MSRSLLLPFLVMIVIGTSVAWAGDEPTLALTGFDPVLLSQGNERAGLEELTVVHEDFLYRFADERTHKTFLEAPQRWGIQLGGACGAMPSAKGDPDRFAVHAGRVYIFGSDGCRTEFMAEPKLFLDRHTRSVAILIFEGVELLDFAGPGEVFAAADHGRAFEVFTVAATVNPIVSQGFVTIVPEYSIESAPTPDILVIPGGSVSSLIDNPAVRAWIMLVAGESEHVLSVCNGALVLADLGLLDGMEATTHHTALDSLRERTGVTVLEDVRFVDNGHILTSAGVSAGIDGALHLVEQLLGTGTATDTAAYMEYERHVGSELDQ